MPSLYVPGSTGGFVHQGAEVLDRQLRDGDGIMWTGDPRLELRMGILTDKRTRRTARRYEVWRHMEDGRDEQIGTWKMDEVDMILHDLAIMKAGAEGRAPDVSTRIDAANAVVERKALDQYRDNMGPMLDHAARLKHDRTYGPNTFRQVGGSKDA